jgi:hypothetical protein
VQPPGTGLSPYLIFWCLNNEKTESKKEY